VSAPAGEALLDASSALTEFGNVDKRVRDYLKADEALMASDVVFSEGTVAAARAAARVETARLAEHQSFDADEGTLRRLEAYTLGAAGGLSVLILAILGFARGGKAEVIPEMVNDTIREAKPDADELLIRHRTTFFGPAIQKAEEMPMPSAPSASSMTLKAAADLCTEFGRIHDLAELRALLGSAARLMDASGLVVWLGNPDGADLQPVLAHGYSDQVLALMRPVARSGDNAAAAAYRTGALQVVGSRAGSPLGAVVAPLLAADGCVGALTAEVKDGGERSEQVHALASIFAAQLAGILSTSVGSQAASQTRSATA
jgi:hypothetical protein